MNDRLKELTQNGYIILPNYFKRETCNNVIKEINNIIDNKIKINILGRLNSMPFEIKKTLKNAVKKTKNNKKLIVNLAINYGSKNEIIDSIKKLNSKSKIINEENINHNLYSKLPFPDILIRTGGKKRLSNFMLWQLAYAEIFFLAKLWPDFSKNDLNKVIKKYYKIKRNFGSI